MRCRYIVADVPGRELWLAQRLVFPECAISVGAQREDRRVEGVVVVPDLVVVPRQQPGRHLVGPLQVGVGLVQRILLPEPVQRVDRPGVVARQRRRVGPAHGGRVRGVLVDVVTGEEDEVRRFGRGVLPRVVPTGPERLARRHDEVQKVDRGSGGGRGAGPPHGAEMRSGTEAVPVVPVRLQPHHVDVDRMRVLRVRRGRTGADHVAEARVGGDLPEDRLSLGSGTSPDLEGTGRQPGPDHDRGRQRVA